MEVGDLVQYTEIVREASSDVEEVARYVLDLRVPVLLYFDGKDECQGGEDGATESHLLSNLSFRQSQRIERKISF